MKDTHPLGSSTDVIIAPKGMVLIVNPFEFFKTVSLMVDIFKTHLIWIMNLVITFTNNYYNRYFKNLVIVNHCVPISDQVQRTAQCGK